MTFNVLLKDNWKGYYTKVEAKNFQDAVSQCFKYLGTKWEKVLTDEELDIALKSIGWGYLINNLEAFPAIPGTINYKPINNPTPNISFNLSMSSGCALSNWDEFALFDNTTLKLDRYGNLE